MTLSTTPSGHIPRTPSTARKLKQTYTLQELDALPVLDVAEVAQLLRITPDTVRREIKAGNLQAENYGSGTRPVYRIPREALQRWRDSRTVTPSTQGQE